MAKKTGCWVEDTDTGSLEKFDTFKEAAIFLKLSCLHDKKVISIKSALLRSSHKDKLAFKRFRAI